MILKKKHRQSDVNAHAFEKTPSRCYYHRCCEKKASCANPAHDTISATPIWEFRNAKAITKSIGVFIAADLRPFSVVDKQANKMFPLTINHTVLLLYRTVTFVYHYTPNRCVSPLKFLIHSSTIIITSRADETRHSSFG
jgi:hypothetical protein